MRSETAYFVNSTKTSSPYELTYKIPNASPKGMHPREQHKNVPNKNKKPLIPKKHKLPTTLNTTAKDKAQKVAQQQLIKNAARRIPNNKKFRAKRGQSNTIPPLNPEERGMSGPEPPPSEARLHGWLFYSIYCLLHIQLLSLPASRRGPPQAPALVNSSNHTQTIHFTQKRPFHKEPVSMALAPLVPPSGRRSSANAHTVKPKRTRIDSPTTKHSSQTQQNGDPV